MFHTRSEPSVTSLLQPFTCAPRASDHKRNHRSPGIKFNSESFLEYLGNWLNCSILFTRLLTDCPKVEVPFTA